MGVCSECVVIAVKNVARRQKELRVLLGCTDKETYLKVRRSSRDQGALRKRVTRQGSTQTCHFLLPSDERMGSGGPEINFDAVDECVRARVTEVGG